MLYNVLGQTEVWLIGEFKLRMWFRLDLVEFPFNAQRQRAVGSSYL